MFSNIPVIKVTSSLALGSLIICFINYAVSIFKYYRARRQHGKGLILPTYPTFIPYFGNVISLTLDTADFISRATMYKGKLTSTAVSFMGFKLYLFQDRETIGHFMKHQDLCSPMSLYTFALSHFFGMPQKALRIYLDDNSGPHRRPFPGTDANFRIDYILHHNFVRAWSGPGLIHTTQRFRRALQARIDVVSGVPSDSWLQAPDFFQFFLQTVSASITEAVFGSSLLRINPHFLNDLWAYDSALPWMARGVPSLIMPGPYQIRDRLCAQIKRWQAHARHHFRECDIEVDGADPFWGSEIVRYLQELFTKANTHDEEALSAHHLGMIFAANFNLVPSVLVTALHIVSVPGLVQRVREEIDGHFVPGSLQDVKSTEPRKILQLPLLSSIYAESLRLHVKVFFFANSPRADVSVGKWHLPQGSLGLVNTDGPHTEEGVWNTRNGQYPVDSFWADRFIVDPLDPVSGPLSPGLRSEQQGGGRKVDRSDKSSRYFTTDGVKSSWIPYGGGPAICPGRFLAQYVIMFTCAVLISEFDIEPVGQPNIEQLDVWRYGLGVLRPKNLVPMRIRRRKGKSSKMMAHPSPL